MFDNDDHNLNNMHVWFVYEVGLFWGHLAATIDKAFYMNTLESGYVHSTGVSSDTGKNPWNTRLTDKTWDVQEIHMIIL